MNILGIALALVLVLVSFALLDSMNDIFSFYYEDFMNYDADVYFTSPVPEEKTSGISQLGAVEEEAPYLLTACRFEG